MNTFGPSSASSPDLDNQPISPAEGETPPLCAEDQQQNSSSQISGASDIGHNGLDETELDGESEQYRSEYLLSEFIDRVARSRDSITTFNLAVDLYLTMSPEIQGRFGEQLKHYGRDLLPQMKAGLGSPGNSGYTARLCNLENVLLAVGIDPARVLNTEYQLALDHTLVRAEGLARSTGYAAGYSQPPLLYRTELATAGIFARKLNHNIAERAARIDEIYKGPDQSGWLPRRLYNALIFNIKYN